MWPNRNVALGRLYSLEDKANILGIKQMHSDEDVISSALFSFIIL